MGPCARSRSLLCQGIHWSSYQRSAKLSPAHLCGRHRRQRNKTRKLMGRCPFSEDEKRIHAVTNVRYLGNQNLRAVYQHIAEADLGLLLLQPVPAYAYPGENTLKLFEYMWCELRLVSSDFPNLRQIIDAAQCGICIDPCNAERATVAIMNLLDQPELRQQMGPTVAMRSFGL